MTGPHDVRDTPLVSVILTSSAGRGDARAALRSALRQTCREVEVIVANDGPVDLAQFAEARRPEVCLLAQRPGRSRAAALNEAVRAARGHYVCYLREQDVHYPHHVRTLVDAIQAGGHGVAYSDAYTTVYRPTAGGRREVLGKVLWGGGDFDRFGLLARDHIPPPALMHRRDLLATTGPFNEKLRRLVDWDMHRRLAFFSDFIHVPCITAEQYVPDGELADTDPPTAEIAEVRSARPPKPWPKMPDLGVIFAPETLGPRELGAIRELHCHTSAPNRLYVTATRADAGLLEGTVPAAIQVPVGLGWPWEARVDRAIRQCAGQADCVAILPEAPVAEAGHVEAALHALLTRAAPNEAVRLPLPVPGAWGAVAWAAPLSEARRRHPALSIPRSLEADGVALASTTTDDARRTRDLAATEAPAAEADGDYHQAARLYKAAGRAGADALWTAEGVARALYCRGGRDGEALAACRRVNRRRPTVASLLLEARLLRRNHRVEDACRLLEKARASFEPSREHSFAEETKG